MLRRMNLMALCVALMFLTVGPVRELANKSLEDPRVQAYVAASANTGAIATSSLIEYIRTRPITFQNGKPVLTVSGPSGTRTVGTVDTADNWSLNHGCSLTAEEVEAVLKGYSSPAATEGGFGQMTVDECKRTGIDNAYVLAMFIHESTAGTAGAAVETHSTGNIICTDSNCAGRFQVYPDWKAGGRAHFTLLKCYRDGGGEGCTGLWNGKKHDTIVDAIYTWAPPSDGNNQNQDCTLDPGSYPCAVKKDVANWRNVHTTVAPAQAAAAAAPAGGNDLRAKVIELALSRQGDPYVSGARGAGGSDCSGFVQYVYKTATGINPGSTTFDQWPNLKHVELKDVQPGDLWYGRWNDSGAADSEHTGIVADVDGDGKFDLIHNGWDKSEVHVTSDFLSTDLANRTLGFATVLGK